MRLYFPVLASVLFLAGCVDGKFPRHGETPDTAQSAVVAPGTVSSPVPSTSARTEEEFDTTTEAERIAAASAPPAQGEKGLGKTIASLGNAADPGFWVRTPLVDDVAQGRVVAGNGNSAQVELRPSNGDNSGGSEASLATLRLLDVPLTELVPLDVFLSR
jgi:hypothetical protein